ncbi:TetR/AcrR family transcriptional regulator [Ruegeria jejuensis]|uniref:TetR/AcrR family transcriptional regulator n=1 Tax=Ruegeria jejuensis TaxID=3233338 RepID=UPI00355AFCA0
MTDTRTRILDLAEDLTQAKGFNGFSYLDLAAGVGVKSSSIHYYFKAKADLALALVERLRDVQQAVMEGFDNEMDKPEDRIQGLIKFFEGYVRNDKICMCGMMAAEFAHVSPDVHRALSFYFRDTQTWLVKQFVELGQPNPQQSALSFLSALQGSHILARVEGDPALVGRALGGYLPS